MNARTARISAALAASALAAAMGVVWLSPLRRGRPAAPTPWERSAFDLRGPVDPADPLALLVQCEPSADGRWLVFGVDLERIAGAQSLYVVALDSGKRLHVAEGVLAPQPWDDDGRLVFVDRAADPPEAKWLDVERFEVVAAAPVRELSAAVNAELSGPQWAERSQVRRDQGGYVQTVSWRGRDARLELVTQSLFDIEPSCEPGIVLELRRSADARALIRHDLRIPGRELTLSESSDLAQFRLSPDGARVLVSERAKDEISASVLASVDGRPIAGPWAGEPLSATWLARSDARYVLLGRGEEAELFDLERGRATPLGAHLASELDVRVLGDGRVLRRTHATIDVLDIDGAVQLAVFPAR